MKRLVYAELSTVLFATGNAFGDLRQVTVDCHDASTWEIILLPEEEAVWVEPVNCRCETDDWQIRDALKNTYAKEYIRRAIDRGGPLKDATQRAREVNDILSDFPIVGSTTVQANSSDIRLPDRTRINTGTTTLWCYTADQIGSYFERIDEILETVFR